MHIVRFQDGKYGIRSLWFNGWQYLDLENYRNWYSFRNKRSVNDYCRTHDYNKVWNVTSKILDYGSLKQKRLLKQTTGLTRMISSYSVGWFLVFTSLAILKPGYHQSTVESVLYVCSLPSVIYLICRGMLIEPKLINLDSGWDK